MEGFGGNTGGRFSCVDIIFWIRYSILEHKRTVPACCYGVKINITKDVKINIIIVQIISWQIVTKSVKCIHTEKNE